jgi:hypothetical protein
MNFREIAEKHRLADVKQRDVTLLTFFDPSDDNAVLVHWDEEETQATFDENTHVMFNENGTITVRDRSGDLFTFEAYATMRVLLSNEERAINLVDARIDNLEPNRMYVKVGKFDVLLNHTDEGLVVDVYPWVEVDGPGYDGFALATLCAFDSDADDAMGVEE